MMEQYNDAFVDISRSSEDHHGPPGRDDGEIERWLVRSMN